MKCNTYNSGFLWDYKYVVIFAVFSDKWVFCKHKSRESWETAGGHIETGETPLDAAKRELFEETGALEFEIKQLCDYWACDEPHETRNLGWANGVVFFAEITTLGELPESETEKIELFETIPTNQTYPDIMAALVPVVENFSKSVTSKGRAI